MQSLEGKVTLITGGGRGLGQSICKVLAESGARIVCADIRQDLAGQVANDLQKSGCECMPLHLDVADERSVDTAVNSIISRLGHIDVLINNAAIDATLPIEEMNVARWDGIINTNLRGPFLASKYVFPVMKARRSGHIVNIASTASKRAWANASAYHASKWGLLGFSHALHVEARKYQIKVSAVVSGGMKTPFLLDRFPDIDVNTLQDPDNVARTIQFILMQPDGTVIPEIMVLPVNETSWP